MDKNRTFVVRQPNYSIEAKKEMWSLNEAIVLLTKYGLAGNRYESSDECNKHISQLRESFFDLVESEVKFKKIALNIKVYDEDYYESCGEYGGIDISACKVSPVYFITWAVNKGISVPEEFIQILPLYSTAVTEPVDLQSKYSSENEDVNLKYPSYKGVPFESLKKEEFDELKKYYGMLQKEVDKLNKAVSSVAKIGLLFYGKGLNKPATANEFREMYKKEFDGIPVRLIDTVYEALPDDYKNLSGVVSNKNSGVDEDMLVAIIEASVAAGLLRSKNDLAGVTDLEQKLIRFELDPVDQKYLKGISGACKRMFKKLNAEDL